MGLSGTKSMIVFMAIVSSFPLDKIVVLIFCMPTANTKLDDTIIQVLIGLQGSPREMSNLTL